MQARLNILVSGGTGAGKTTMLNILSNYIPSTERIVTIEDSAELQLQQDHVVRLETRPPNIEGAGAVTARDLVRNALRMRPDRIVVGEVRGGEVLDMLQAMNTGHDGSMSTVHANSTRDALSRIETMVLMSGLALPMRAMRDYIASALDVVIQLARLSDGTRKLVRVTEIVGMEEDVVTTQDIFVFEQQGVDKDGRGQRLPPGDGSAAAFQRAAGAGGRPPAPGAVRPVAEAVHQMMLLGVAALVFVVIVTVIAGLWWVWTSGERVRRRLARHVEDAAPERLLLRSDVAASQPVWERLARKSDLVGQLARLSEQAGSKRSASQVLMLIGVVAVVGGIVGGWRANHAGVALISAIVAGALPVFHLMHKRHRRLQRFQEHFADAVDMISRAIRAGNALSAAIQLVGDEMADPIGHEFRHVTEEIRLGLDPGEALLRLQQRVATEDVEFFCTAIRIQRGSGGNLAEILDRLSDVIRKRFELLSHARVLSAQQRYAAIFVGVSPALFSVIFYFLSPGYFDPLIESPLAPMLVGAGLSLEVVGALVIWRLAKIKV